MSTDQFDSAVSPSPADSASRPAALLLPDLIDRLGIPGIFDVHSHFMPEPVMRKVWAVFDRADDVYGTSWPVQYRFEAQARLDVLRSFGVKAFTSMIYAHKPGMSQWLNSWAAEFAAETPDCVHTSTFFPEPGVAAYVREALEAGTRCFKLHLQVGGFDPCDPLLADAWGIISEAGIPVVVHCGSGPVAGTFTGPGPIGEVVGDYPNLKLIVAHMGAPEYQEFLAMAARRPNVRLDTTMAFTDFMNDLAPFPGNLDTELLAAGLRGDVLFGSDFPNIPYPYPAAVEALYRLGYGDDWLAEVLWTAAARLFDVEAS